MATSGSFNYISSPFGVVSSVAGFVTTPVNAGSYFLQSVSSINVNVPIASPPAATLPPFSTASVLDPYPSSIYLPPVSTLGPH
jgi:hypothetical protein